MVEKLNLQYAASDFIVNLDGDIVFLEANPHGAWLWLDECVPHLNITKRFARYLEALVR